MNKAILSLPLPILNKYVEMHFSELSVDDFFEVVKRVNIPGYYFDRNDLLNENSDVLSYMLDKDSGIFRYFKSNAVNKECVEKISKSNINLELVDLDNYPQLLNNDSIFIRMVTKYPSIIKRVDSSKINNQVINILEEVNYILNEEDIKKNSIFMKSKKLLIRAVDNNPELIMHIKELRQLSFIMEYLIEKDAKYISLIGDKCYIDYNLAVSTLNKYKITREDLENNPDLARNNLIMKLLPEFRLYYANITVLEKKEVMFEHLKGDYSLSIEKFPFLDHRFGGSLDIDKLLELFNLLYVDVNNKKNNKSENIKQQEFYYNVLDKLVDGIVIIRYINKKREFKYPDIVSLNDSLVELFNSVTDNKKNEMFNQYIKEMCMFIGKKSDENYIKRKIEEYYDSFKEMGMVDLSLTSKFCNRLLNQHRNSFMSDEKKRIFNELIFKIDLKDEKKDTILNGKKLKFISLAIRQKNFELLGLSEDDFLEEINKARIDILNDEVIINYGMVDSHLLDNLCSYFENYGDVNRNVVSKTLKIDNQDIIKIVSKRFEEIRIKLIGNVKLSKYDERISNMEKIKLGGSINYNNYLIADKNRYLRNVIDILLEINKDELDKILDNKDLLNEIIYLVPLVNLMDEFNTRTFINILSNYERIKNKICDTYNVDINYDNKELLLKYIDNLILLANAYSSIDDIALFALGDKVVSKVGEHESDKYLDFYLKVLNRQNGSIPPVTLETNKYYLESGMYSDVDRLLIGKILNGISCIDLYNFAGGKTYKEVLLKEDGDVILVRDKKKRLISRILLFRKGNVIQMVTHMFDKYPVELFKEIADIIMNKAICYDDNIDYIFVNSSSVNMNNNDYPVIEDSRFLLEFPHADFDVSAILLSSKRDINGLKKDDLDLKLDVKAKVSYLKARRKISFAPTEMEISRIRALDIMLEKDLVEKDKKARNFEPFYINEYERVICGEDWYIALDKNGFLEEVVLPSNDHRTYDEFNQIKEEIFMIDNRKKLL